LVSLSRKEYIVSRRFSRRPFLAAPLALGLTSLDLPTSLGVEAQGATPVTTEQIPEEVAAHAAEWPLPNRDYANARATTDAAISSDNVNELGVAWSFPIPGTGPYGSASSTPIVVDGVVYFQDLTSNVFALDFESGEVLWEHRYDNPVVGPNGAAVGWGKVFVTASVDTVSALDIDTGEEVWAIQLEGPTGSIQPTVYDNTVYVSTLAGVLDESEEAGLRGYAGGATGIAYALDQETGDVRWSFRTVEEGFWGNPDLNAGAGLWFPPAIDTERDMLFYGTGNPAPFPGTVDFPNGSSRPGPNLYSCSIIALDRQSGKLLWYSQVKPHDLFDLDFHMSPVLATAAIDGTDRDIVIGSGKLGRILAFDRETGEVLWNTLVGKHDNDELQEVPAGETIMVLPGVYGGVETPMALADGRIYAAVVNLPTPYTATGHDAKNGSEAVQRAERMTEVAEGTGEIVALDAATGEIQWTHEVDSVPFGAATVSNDLLITSMFEGAVLALDRETGDELWRGELPVPVISFPAVVEDTIVVAGGAGPKARLVAFRLGAPPATPQAEATPAG
jgi:outer membrane protein assembly factor BamB